MLEKNLKDVGQSAEQIQNSMSMQKLLKELKALGAESKAGGGMVGIGAYEQYMAQENTMTKEMGVADLMRTRGFTKNPQMTAPTAVLTPPIMQTPTSALPSESMQEAQEMQKAELFVQQLYLYQNELWYV